MDSPTQKKTIIAYKGFDKDWSCRGFKYGEPAGQTFSTDKPISLCNFGFHACEFPLDIWRYFPPINGNRAAAVELEGTTDEKSDDSKRVARSITLKASLTIPALVSASIEWVFAKVKQDPDNAARIGSSAYDASIGSSAHDASIGSSGDAARIGSSGYAASIGSSGYAARIGSSGYDARIGSSGDTARIGSSGDDARIGSSGDAARIGSSGNAARIGSSGYAARIGSSGYAARIEASGENSVIATAGDDCKFKLGTNGSAAIRYTDKSGRARFSLVYVGENGIKADTWYVLDDSGNFKEIA